jgi:hypothetical protein
MILKHYRDHTQSYSRRLTRWSVVLLTVLVSGSLTIAPVARATEDQSYKALRDWIEQSRTVPPTFTPGQHLTEADRKVLEPFLPQSAWEYYVYPGMDRRWRQPDSIPSRQTGRWASLQKHISMTMACSSGLPVVDSPFLTSKPKIHKQR